MNEKDFRDVCAMFAMLGWCMNGDFHESEIPSKAWRLADAMLEARDKEPEEGIAVIKKRVRKS